MDNQEFEDTKSVYHRIGDRSWKSPRKRMKVILLCGLILFLAFILCYLYSDIMTANGMTKQEVLNNYRKSQHIPHYQIIINKYD